MTQTSNTTFTSTHAAYIASKVASDLRQMQIFYGKPSDDQIDGYVDELIQFLVAGAVVWVEYGYKRGEEWIVSLRYGVRNGTLADTGAGGVYARADVSGATFHSYLVPDYNGLDAAQVVALKDRLPFQRTGGEEPKHVSGTWDFGKSYTSGGVSAERTQWRPQ